jgi:hypothetical protein
MNPPTQLLSLRVLTHLKTLFRSHYYVSPSFFILFYHFCLSLQRCIVFGNFGHSASNETPAVSERLSSLTFHSFQVLVYLLYLTLYLSLYLCLYLSLYVSLYLSLYLYLTPLSSIFLWAKLNVRRPPNTHLHTRTTGGLLLSMSPRPIG